MPSASLAPSPTPTLPSEPVLVGATKTETTIVYEIAISPLPDPVRYDDGIERARKIGALIGATTFQTVSQDRGGGWRITWPQSFDGFPVEDGTIVLDLYRDGTVWQFRQEIGPRAPTPARPITRSQAELAIGSAAKSNDARLEWARAGTNQFHLVWWLHFGVLDPETDHWPCVQYVDAGTAALLQSMCVS